MKAADRRRGHRSAGRWRWIAAVSALGALLVVLAGPARSLSSSSVSKPSVKNSSPSAAAGAQTRYVVTFTTSANGALSNAAGSGITLVFPADTGLGSVFASSVDDISTESDGIGTCSPPSGETITCSLVPGAAIAAGDSVRVTLRGVRNPSTPSSSLTLSVSTTSDKTPVKSAPYRVLPAHQISQPSVNNSSRSATAGMLTPYVVQFTASRTGRLSNFAGSEITLVFPSGTGLGSVFASSVDDTTTGSDGNGTCNPPSGETITCSLVPGAAIAAGDSVRVTIKGVRNPSTPSSSLTLSVSTTSDTTPVNSAPYSVSPPPVPGRSADVAPASGVVLVKRPGQNTFFRLRTGQRIRLGSVVDATHGSVSLVVATNHHGHRATGQASGGPFKVTQKLTPAGVELTILRLAGPKLTCSAAADRAGRPRRHRAMTFRDPGFFRTIGIYAWGRGQATSQTTWRTEDSCAGTLISVMRGTVLFDDLPHHKQFVMGQGQSFLAHPGPGG